MTDVSDATEKQSAPNATLPNTTSTESPKNASFAVPSIPTAASAQEHPPAPNANPINTSSTPKEHANSALTISSDAIYARTILCARNASKRNTSSMIKSARNATRYLHANNAVERITVLNVKIIYFPIMEYAKYAISSSPNA